MSQNAEVTEFLPVRTREEADDAVDRMMACQEAYGHCFWAVERKADGAFIGTCGIVPPRDPFTEYEIGWRLGRSVWGQGYAREGAEATLAWAWSHVPADTIIAVTVPGNTRSWGLMERLGMTRHADEDFDHPDLDEDDPLRPHIFYRIRRPAPAPRNPL